MAVWALTLLVTLSTRGVAAQDTVNAIDDSEAYAVYAAALFNWGYESRSANLMTVAIEDRTAGSLRCPHAFTGQRFGIDLDALAANFVSSGSPCTSPEIGRQPS